MGKRGGHAINRDIVTTVYGVAILAVAGFLYWQSTTMEFANTGIGVAHDPLFFPRVLIALMSLLAIVMIGQALVSTKTALPQFRWGLLGIILIVIAGYFMSLKAIGFGLSSMGFMAVFMVLLGYRRWPVILAIAILVPLAIWWAFYGWLQVPVPTSPFSQVF